MKHLSVLSRCLLALTLCLASWMVSAQLAPMPQKALQWLQSQVQSGGILAGVNNSVGTPLQARAEVVQTLRAVATTPVAMASGVLSENATDTELLSRRILSGVDGGLAVNDLLTQLSARQAADGSVGAHESEVGNALDTAWALQAWKAAGQANAAPAVKARAFLVSQVGADGQWLPPKGTPVPGASQRLHAQAMISLGLQTGTESTSLSAVARLTDALIGQQMADGSWGADTLLTARVLEAVASAKDAPDVRSKALHYLETRQAVDGSWDSDAYITAVALRGMTVQPSVTLPESSGGGVSPPASATTSSITAIVLDGGNAQPLRGVTASVTTVPAAGGVSTAAGAAASDDAGLFKIAGLAAGSYRLQFSRAGYDTRSFDIQVGAGQLVNFGQVALAATATSGIVSGVVSKQSDGQPLSGVAISLVTSAGTRAVNTDSQGRFEFSGVQPGSLSISATVTGYQTASGTATVVAGQRLDFSPALLASGQQGGTNATYKAKVVSALSDTPLPGAKITLSAQPSGATLSGVAGADGQVNIAGLVAGEYALTCELPGYKTVSQRFVLPPNTSVDGGTIRLGVVLNTVDVSGRVSNDKGVAIAGAVVQVFNADSAAITVTTGADGRYGVSGVQPGALRIRVSGSGYLAKEAALSVGSGQVSQDFVLQYAAPANPLLKVAATMPAAPVAQGAQALVAARLTNDGTAAATVAVHLDVRDLQGGFIGAGTALGAGGIPQAQFVVSAGQGADVPLAWNVVGVTPGAYKAWVRVFDAASGALLAQATGPISVAPGAQLPDLVVQSVSRGSAVSDASQYTVQGALKMILGNRGNAPAAGGFAVLAFSDTNGNGAYDDGIDQVLGRLQVAQALSAGDQVELSVPVAGRLPFRDAPVHVLVDSDKVVVESDEGNNLGWSAEGARLQPQIGTFKPKLKWHWKTSASHQYFDRVEMAPVVGRIIDTNGDGRIDAADATVVAFVAHISKGGEGVIHVVRGDTGKEVLAIRDATNPIAGVGGLALADLDGDGRPEIVALSYSGGVNVYRNDGTRLWASGNVGTSAPWAAPMVADLDGDGQPEIVAWRTVFNRDGSVKWTANTSYWGGSSLPIAADLFGTGKQNLIIGAAVFNHDGTLRWNKSRNCFTAVADFDRDGVPEIVCVSSGLVELYSRDGTLRWSTALPGGGNGGPPTVADLDGDGIPEIGIAGSSLYVALKANGIVHWTKPIQDYSSSTTGSTVFDFDGDGSAEVLYSDEVRVRAFAGKDGRVLWEIPHESVTSLEYPLVVDLNGDGHAEMVTVGSGSTYNGVRVFEDENNSWVNVREVWNQHAYSITNINDDLTVPRQPQPSWLAHNTFRLNTTPGRSPTAVADGTAGGLHIEVKLSGDSLVHVRIANAGSLALPANTGVALYAESVSGGRTLLSVKELGQALEGGRFIDLNWAAQALGQASRLVVVLDDDGTGKSRYSDFDRSNNTVSLDLQGVPVALGLAVSTDKPAYESDQPVIVSARLSNVSDTPAPGARVRLSVLAPDGRIIAVLGELTTTQIGARAVADIPAVWNSAQWLAAPGYQARAQLLNGAGDVVSEHVAAFAITAGPESSQIRATIRTDRLTYGPSDTVVVTDRVNNSSLNAVLESLTAQTSITAPNGALVWSSSQAIEQLVAGAGKELSFRVPLTMAAGIYTARLSVSNAQGSVVTMAQAVFTVESTAVSGQGVTGALSIAGSPVASGDAVALSWQVRNQGNDAIDPAQVFIRLVDPEAGTEVAKLNAGAIALPAGQSRAASLSWTTPATLVDKTLVAVLTAQVGTASIDLAQASFVVTKPPVKLDVAQDIKAGTGGAAKVLVLYDCEPDLGWDLLGWLRLSYTHACYKERAQYLSNYLGSLNVAHYITYDRNAFRRELRSGAYTSIWMLGALPDCGPNLLNEVREAVNRGATLLVDGGTTAYENHALYRLAGARYGGHIWLSNKAMDVSGASFTSTRLSTVGLPLRLSLSGGTVLASYPRQYCYRVDYDGDDNTPHPSGSSYPAVVGNAYGRGKALAFGFDLISALRNGGSDTAAWKRFVTESAGYLKPIDEQRALVAGEMAVFGTKLSNQGSAVGIEARMSLPAAAQVVGTTPQAVLEPGNKVLWKFDLGAGQSVPLQLTLRAPLSTGSYTVGSEMAVVRNGQKQPYASYSQSFNVMDSLAPAKAAYQKLLSLTGVPFLESLNWLSAKVNLDYGIKLYQQGRYHEAVEELGEAANNIRQLSAPLSAERLAVDRLMQEAQYRWYLAQPK